MWRQDVEADFFFRPEQDARAQTIRLDEAFHKAHLIEADGQEEGRKGRQVLFAQAPAAIEIVAARQVALRQMRFIVLDTARQSPSDRPERTGIQRLEQHRV